MVAGPDSELGASRLAPSSTPTPRRSTSSPPSQAVASANVVVLGLAQRSGQPISFLEFTKYGAVVALATMLVCVPYLLLRYFVLA